MLRQLRKLARDATQADLERQRVEEELKLKVWKLEAAAKEGARDRDSGETFGALLEEFEEEHTSERLRSEVRGLRFCDWGLVWGLKLLTLGLGFLSRRWAVVGFGKDSLGLLRRASWQANV